MQTLERRLPALLASLAGIYLLLQALPPRRRSPDLEGFGRLPVLQGGRLKPLDTVARNALLMLRGKQSVREGGRAVAAVEWLLDAAARPEQADGYKVFAVDDPDLLGLVGRQREAGRYLSFSELSPFLREIQAQAERAAALEPPQRSRFEAAVVQLRERLTLYEQLKNTLQVEGTEDLPAELAAYGKVLGPGVAAVLARQGSVVGFDRKALSALHYFFERYRFLTRMAYYRPLPPAEGESPEGWRDVGTALLESMRGTPVPPAASAYAAMLRAWRLQDAAAFDKAFLDYRAWLAPRAPRARTRAGWESLFNRFQPFYQGMALYVAAFLLAALSWLAWAGPLRRSAHALLLLALGVHTAGLAMRIALQGRPPVTNLYSSAVFVGWVAVLLGAALERRHPRGFATAASSAMGLCTLLVAHHLSDRGDTLEMMQAVLDSNFWLGTHVVAITIGYGSTFLAGALAHAYILRGLLRPADREAGRALASMTYGVICFSLLFSFIGTMLGGIWADQSWGRFWGWDPKENGALLIVLWNAFILHARWAGYARERGMMILAVFGNVVTSLSWFGVNMLGIGLHSYGWMGKTFFWLSAFCLSQLLVMALAWRLPRAAGEVRA